MTYKVEYLKKPLIGSSSTFKLKSRETNQNCKLLEIKTTSNRRPPKNIKITQQLCIGSSLHHLNLKPVDLTKIENVVHKDDLQWKRTATC